MFSRDASDVMHRVLGRNDLLKLRITGAVSNRIDGVGKDSAFDFGHFRAPGNGA